MTNRRAFWPMSRRVQCRLPGCGTAVLEFAEAEIQSAAGIPAGGEIRFFFREEKGLSGEALAAGTGKVLGVLGTRAEAGPPRNGLVSVRAILPIKSRGWEARRLLRFVSFATALLQRPAAARAEIREKDPYPRRAIR